MFQATGDAVVLVAADLQDPPEMIVKFVEKWKDGNDSVFFQINRRLIIYKPIYKIYIIIRS
jgi:dolichol-phosphate mannosyltransferase